MSTSKKLYKALARAVGEYIVHVCGGNIYSDCANIANSIADTLLAENPLFDRSKFMKHVHEVIAEYEAPQHEHTQS